MRTRIGKWGNSLALRLPKAFTSSHALREGSAVELTEHADGILLRPAGNGYDLEGLLKEVKPGNRHRSIETGDATGKEVW